MKHYFFNGHEFTQIPDPITLADGSHVSPVTEAVFRALGGTITDDGLPSPFEAACAQFRTLCGQIGAFIGDAEFRGGFDEYTEFATSEAYKHNPVQGNALAIQWSALNELCKYEGSKEGFGQPEWWYRCWEMAD